MELDTRSGSDAVTGYATVTWTYLESYEGMGNARFACVSGCACPGFQLNCFRKERTSIFKIAYQRKVWGIGEGWNGLFCATTHLDR